MARLERFGLLVAMGLLAALAIAACGGSGGSGSGSGSGVAPTGSATASSVTSVAGKGPCGTIPTRMPPDPDGVLAKLSPSTRAAYNLYPQPVRASAWRHWKPKHSGPYTVYVNIPTGTPFAALIVNELKHEQAQSHLVSRLIVQDPSQSPQTQIQQLQQTISAKKVDVIITFDLAPTADAPVLERAGKAGIPVITPNDTAVTPYVVGINGNTPLQGADLMQALTRVMGEKGDLVEMQGISGVAANDDVLEGAQDVLNACPKVTVAGKPVGDFAAAPAKTAMLEFLAAHPQPINATFQVGGMATGIIQAFQQTGRMLPPIGDLGATPGALAYWNAHKASYKGVSLAEPVTRLADAAWSTAVALLQGRGVTVSEILQKPVMVTDANLSQWVQPGWSLKTPLAYAPGPPGAFYSPAYLSRFFSHAR